MWYNRIMAYNVKYNWLTFVNTPFLQEWWCLVLKEFSFYEVATQSNTEKYAIKHWEYVSPTMLKNRRIRFLFDIIANDEQERRALLNQVQRAFTPDRNPSPFNDKLWKDLSFLDINCKEWKCKCQVLQGIQLSDFANQKRAWISVELITDNPYFESNREYSVKTRNTLMWIKLPTKLAFKRQYYKWVINYTWTLSTPTTIELNILDNDSSKYPFDKIKVIRQQGDYLEVFHLEDITDLDLQVWDKITIDSNERRVYLENADWKTEITWLVKTWSIRPVLEWWLNTIAIDTGVRDECIEATIKWKDLF